MAWFAGDCTKPIIIEVQNIIVPYERNLSKQNYFLELVFFYIKRYEFTKYKFNEHSFYFR